MLMYTRKGDHHTCLADVEASYLDRVTGPGERSHPLSVSRPPGESKYTNVTQEDMNASEERRRTQSRLALRAYKTSWKLSKGILHVSDCAVL